MNLNDRMRISDSARGQVAAQLRDYYAEGRLTNEELAERVTAALNAKTAGDLRRLMTDLPSPAPAAAGPSGPGAQSYGAWPRGGSQWPGRPDRRPGGAGVGPILRGVF